MILPDSLARKVETCGGVSLSMLLLEEQRDVIDGAAMCVCKVEEVLQVNIREMSAHFTLERCLEPFTQCIKSIITCRHLFHLHVNDKTC
jgi:hypothetical protein